MVQKWWAFEGPQAAEEIELLRQPLATRLLGWAALVPSFPFTSKMAHRLCPRGSLFPDISLFLFLLNKNKSLQSFRLWYSRAASLVRKKWPGCPLVCLLSQSCNERISFKTTLLSKDKWKQFRGSSDGCRNSHFSRLEHNFVFKSLAVFFITKGRVWRVTRNAKSLRGRWQTDRLPDTAWAAAQRSRKKTC